MRFVGGSLPVSAIYIIAIILFLDLISIVAESILLIKYLFKSEKAAPADGKYAGLSEKEVRKIVEKSISY